MIHDQGPAGIIVVTLHQGHHRICRRNDNRAGRAGHVHTIVRTAWLAVVDPLAAVDSADSPGQRPLKITEKSQQGRVGIPRRLDLGHLATNPL